MKQVKFESSKKAELIDLTEKVKTVVKASGLEKGVCLVYCPHSTAGLTVNENFDPDVKKDLLSQLEKLAPRNGKYRHAEGNADAHVKSSLSGVSLLLPVEKGKPVLGKWQGVLFAEFDGPRQRNVLVQLIASR